MPKGHARNRIPNRIAYWRERRGWTQTELAEILRVSRGTIARWEVGGYAPLPEMRPLIARALKRPERDVFPSG